MSAPSKLFSKLSLESIMTPTTRAQSQRNLQSESPSQSNPDGPQSRPGSQSDTNPQISPPRPASIKMRGDGDDGDDDEEEQGEEDGIVHSPTTNLRYDISGLPSDTQSRVEDAFREPPQIALHHCRLRDGVYAFQMTELVPHSIRIGHPGSTHTFPTCSCAAENNSNKTLEDLGESTKGDKDAKAPCKHLLWLLDQVAKQTTAYEHNQKNPLTLNTKGYANEMGDPFQEISRFHLDVLADSLHCTVVPDPSLPSPVSEPPEGHDMGPGSGDEEEAAGDDDDDDDNEEEESRIPSPLRVLEAREVLSSVANVPVDEWRTDLSAPPRWRGRESRGRRRGGLVRHGDLEATLFRMLITNDNLFHTFMSQLRASDPINNPFRKLGQRVDRVLADLDAYSAFVNSSSFPGTASSSRATAVPPPPPQPTAASQSEDKAPEHGETSNTVGWAARHIEGVVRIINTAIYSRDEPFGGWEERSAAQTLIHILEAVVDRNKDFHPGPTRRDRNLFFRLIGDSAPSQGEDFVIFQLNSLPAASSYFLDTLQEILVKLVDHKAYTRYIEKVKELISRCKGWSRRTSTAAVSPSGRSGRAGSKRRSQTIERDPKRQRQPR